MRRFFSTSIIVLALALFAHAPLTQAQAGANNGAACDLIPGTGLADGLIYNGQCILPSTYPTQSITTGGTSGTPSSITTGVNTGVTQTTGVNTGPSVTLINPLKSGTSLESFLSNILQFVVRLGSVVIILMLVYIGYLFVAAQGNDSKITAARNMLLYTVIGAIILLGAQAIAMSIQATVSALGG